MKKQNDITHSVTEVQDLIGQGKTPLQISDHLNRLGFTFIQALEICRCAYNVNADAVEIWLTAQPIWMKEVTGYQKQADSFMEMILEGEDVKGGAELTPEELAADMEELYPSCLYPDGLPLKKNH